MAKSKENRHVHAIKVHQWLKGWDDVDFDSSPHRRKPEPHFYMFSLPAVELRNLCGITRRQSSGVTPRADDLGIQRQHEPGRSNEIGQFVKYGYPWSTLSKSKRESSEFNDLRKPGWLPTAIVINILDSKDKRRGKSITPGDAVVVEENESSCSIKLPYQKWSNKWRPTTLPPFEVIDGQHRLWAFEKNSDSSFELPVIAFFGLDISWQAYLFWTINIKPKRINPSLAYDMYPLLRAEDWLDRAEGHAVYRETRSQELTEALWAHPDSPWYDRINMLGERQNPWVTQAAWIKSLMATFIRPWHGQKNMMGGLFGSRLRNEDEVLGWNRAQQAAFIIYAWQTLKKQIDNSDEAWLKAREATNKNEKRTPRSKDDTIFYDQFSLIVTDQGVRGFLHILNDLCYAMAPNLDLRSWQLEENAPASDNMAVTNALKSISKHKMAKFVQGIAESLETFDWRTSAAPEISPEERRQKLVFRGSSGYKELRIQLLEHIQKRNDDIGKAADRVINTMT